MPRITPEQAEQMVVDTITAAGGTMTHNDLEQSLSDAGQPDAINYVLNMGQRGALAYSVKAQAQGAPVLVYSVPSPAPAPQPE